MRTKEKDGKGNTVGGGKEKDIKLKGERRTNGCQQPLTDFVSNSFLSSYRTHSSSSFSSVRRQNGYHQGNSLITKATHSITVRCTKKNVKRPAAISEPHILTGPQKSAFYLHYICRSYYRNTHTCTQSYT